MNLIKYKNYIREILNQDRVGEKSSIKNYWAKVINCVRFLMWIWGGDIFLAGLL